MPAARALTAVAAIAAIAATLALAACGGGGGGSSSLAMPAPEPAAEEPAPAPESAPAAEAPKPESAAEAPEPYVPEDRWEGVRADDLPFPLRQHLATEGFTREGNDPNRWSAYTTPGAVSIRSAAPAVAIEAATKTAKRAPVFGSVTQSANTQAAKRAPVFGSVTQSEDGTAVRVSFPVQEQERHPNSATDATNPHGVFTVSDEDGDVVSFHTGRTESDRTELYDRIRPEFEETVSLHTFGGIEARADAGRYASEFPIIEVAADSAIVGRVVVDQDRENPADWTSFGYWMEMRGRDFIASAPRLPTLQAVEVSAFADGAEFRQAPTSLPTTGTATYRGKAVGAYMAEYGIPLAALDPANNFRDYSPDLDGVRDGPGLGGMFNGEFSGPMALSFDFATGTIAGTLREMDVVGVYTHPTHGSMSTGNTQRRTDGPGPGFEIGFSGSFNRETGRFLTTDVRLSDSKSASNPVRRIVESNGAWDGQLSHIVNSADEPRSAIGTFGVEGITAGETRHVFVGAFGLHHERFAGRLACRATVCRWENPELPYGPVVPVSR